MKDTTEAEVLAEIWANRAQLWPGERSAMVTQLLSLPEPTMHVWLAGGSLRDLLALRAGVEAWGRNHGAQFVTINGRPGWARVLSPFGFVRDGEELRKVL